MNFFEPYHGKSDVDSMFGNMTKWMKEWTTTKFINTTEDLLTCFRTHNAFLPNPQNNNYYCLSFSADIWTRIRHTTLTNKFKIRDYNYFMFDSGFPHLISTFRYAFKSNRDTTGVLELSHLVRLDIPILLDKLPAKKAPKYSEVVEHLNSNALTREDEDYLEKRAKSWGVHYTRRARSVMN